MGERSFRKRTSTAYYSHAQRRSWTPDPHHGQNSNSIEHSCLLMASIKWSFTVIRKVRNTCDMQIHLSLALCGFDRVLFWSLDWFETHYTDQAGLKRSSCLCLPNAWITSVHYYSQLMQILSIHVKCGNSPLHLQLPPCCCSPLQQGRTPCIQSSERTSWEGKVSSQNLSTDLHTCAHTHWKQM